MVEWKKLGEIANLVRGKVISKEYIRDNEGEYPVYSSQTANDGVFGCINSYMFDGDFLTWTTDGAYAGTVFRRKGKFNITNVCGLIDIKEKINQGFLYYWLSITAKNYVLEGMGNPKLMSNVAATIPIPIPSLQEQERIVETLDTFTASIDNLKEQIAQRLKQYEHYRDQLLDLEGKEIKGILSFGNDFLLKARIGWQGLTKKEYKMSGEYKLVTGTDFTKNQRIDFNSCVYVDKERYEQDEYIKLKVGDVLLTKDGTLGKVAYIDALELPATLNGGVFVVRDLKNRVLPKFIMFYLTSNHFKKWMQQNHTSGSIQHLTQKLLSSFTIPVFSLSEQERIVSILDTFEASIQNLEAQLAERQKQYEYYRNELLSFEESEGAE